MRIGRDKLFMGIAQTFASRGTCTRAQVGCVIVNDQRHILSHGYNGAPPGMPHCEEVGCGGGVEIDSRHITTIDKDLQLSKSPGREIIFPNGCTRAIHAETNAIAYAASLGVPIAGSTMYTTHQPCRPCAQAIIAAHIKLVIYLEPYRLVEGLELLQESEVEIVKYNEVATAEERDAVTEIMRGVHREHT